MKMLTIFLWYKMVGIEKHVHNMSMMKNVWQDQWALKQEIKSFNNKLRSLGFIFFFFSFFSFFG